MVIGDVIDLGTVLIAIAALALSAYTTRTTLAHQRTTAHEARIWELKVEVVLDFLDWLDGEGSQPRVPEGSQITDDLCPLLGAHLRTRIKVFLPYDFLDESARVQLLVGRWRRAVKQLETHEISHEEYLTVESEASRELTYVRGLANHQITSAPHHSRLLHRYLVEHHELNRTQGRTAARDARDAREARATDSRLGRWYRRWKAS